jgi:hypothetical protein
MVISSKDTHFKQIGPMDINEYDINEDYSAALIKMNGDDWRA